MPATSPSSHSPATVKDLGPLPIKGKPHRELRLPAPSTFSETVFIGSPTSPPSPFHHHPNKFQYSSS